MRAYYLLLIVLFSFLASANEEIPSLEINEISKGVFLHKSYSLVNGWGLVSSNGLVVVNNRKAFIVDTPWSEQDTEKLVNWIRSKNYSLLGSISTHSHEDRTAGIKWLNGQSIATYATELTNSILLKEGKEQARHSLKGNDVELANGLLEVFYPGGGHTIDNVVVWLPKSNILFGGCFVRSLESKGLGYTGEAHIDQWAISAENTISKYPKAKTVIPGHGEIGNIELLKHTKFLAEKASNKSIQPTAEASAD
ncbi:DIM/SIM/IMP family subclass B1 metallo-beta-lactamase [Paraferrimonas sp. SM1919]|uniref:DIM/SIM/IMP family subclass B1 metallo-beta-lactamase n=1 Tax=Paraferrimonas sp. SM1919 TaxID=2662263 RepID=UPI0013D15041|nr:DIM/SIM/IMP family subclass B1 metallo-beta-lactamase [Paraferrimonas sp. SM1919]